MPVLLTCGGENQENFDEAMTHFVRAGINEFLSKDKFTEHTI